MWSLYFYEKYSTSLSTIVLVVLTTANFGGFSNFCRYYTRSQTGKSTGYRPTLKPLPQYRTNSTLSDFNNISYVGRLWCPDLVCRLWCPKYIPDIEKFLVVTIFKMAANIKHCPISSKFDMWVDNDVPNWFPTLKNFYRSPFSKWPPQYHTNSTLSDFNDISHVGRLWCAELISDIEKFLAVVIFKMATTIPHKFIIVRFQRNFICR
jgi:hypothetical protein